MARSANREAVAYFEQALDALQHCPDDGGTIETAFEVRLDLRSALIPLGEFMRVFQTLHELESLAERLKDPRRQGLVAALMAGVYPSFGQAEQAVAYGERARRIAADLGDRTIDVLAHTYLGAAYFSLGQCERSIECTRRVVRLLPGERSHDSFGVAIRPAVFARGFLCWALSELGRFPGSGGRGARDPGPGRGDRPSPDRGRRAPRARHLPRPAGRRCARGRPVERARDCVTVTTSPSGVRSSRTFLGYSLALSARFSEAESLLERRSTRPR